MWRSLDELAGTREFQALLDQEFPGLSLDVADPLSRRRFLALMGASLALGGHVGCGRPVREEIVPYVDSSEPQTAGKPLYFATAMTLGGLATGLLVEQHLGRPTKIEGHPDHPASLGATDIYGQASILTLYDPDRSQSVRHRGQPSRWEEFDAAWQQQRELLRGRGGAGLHLLTETITSPTLVDQLEKLLEEFPAAGWHRYEPLAQDARSAAAEAAFGRALDVVYDFAGAACILALDADFLDGHPGHLRYARQFAAARRVWNREARGATMNRLYAVGPTPTLTWAAADHRLPLRAGQIPALVRTVAVRLGVIATDAMASAHEQFDETWLSMLIDDLRRNRGRCVVLAGEHQPVSVHVLVHAINQHLGNVGQSVFYIPPVEPPRPAAMRSLVELTQAMEAGEVQSLVILGGNPAYNAPADVPFRAMLSRTDFSAHLGMHYDETGRHCQWHLPETHFLESWGDARAFDGTVSLAQPLIEPLYGGRSALELIAHQRGAAEIAPQALLRNYWRAAWATESATFEQRWRQALHDGIIEGTRFAAEAVALRSEWLEVAAEADSESRSLEIVFRADPTVYDGRFAGNAWLQELPKPLSHVTWENVAVFGPRTAAGLGLELQIGEHGGAIVADVVRLEYRGRAIEAPAWILPGQAENSVTLYLGYGREFAGLVGSGRGYNAYQLRTADRPWFDSGLQVTRTGRRHAVATTQLHHLMQGRDLVRAGTLTDYQLDPDRIAHKHSPHKPAGSSEATQNGPASQLKLPVLDDPREPHEPAQQRPPPSLYPEYAYDRYRWGMVIDLNSCIGCSACVVACQAENNIPVVGREEVLRGREMHWLRVDAYHAGHDEQNPDATYFQPVPCMHCEKAPCEVVCPVNATVHSDEGLNDMNYARCIGTRYCANNCPYKVRRFNFFTYADWETESLKALRNPDVTVRSRGVMEKCTYCVQRINRARIHAEKDDRPLVKNRAGTWIKPIYEGELLTACQAACPTQAIVFGDLNDESSAVARMRYDQPLNYGLLNQELGTQPRTTYLAALRNPPAEPGT